MKFIVQAVRDGVLGTFVYDSYNSTIEQTDKIPSQPTENFVYKNSFGKKDNIKTLKISLGLGCNYSCEYCLQRFVPHSKQNTDGQIDRLVELLKASTINPNRIEFWGGEPLLYWKTLKVLAEKLRIVWPNTYYVTVTNGSLLDPEKNKWLDEMGFIIGLSHDGPGHHVRGPDPLADPEIRNNIMDLFNRLNPKKRISINAMLHNKNLSRSDINDFMKTNFGEDVSVGEGSFIVAYDQGGMDSIQLSEEEHINFRRKSYSEFRSGECSNFPTVNIILKDFLYSLDTKRKADVLGQKCKMDNTEILAIDMEGNILTCQNVSSVSVAPNGKSHKSGHISDLSKNNLQSARHWSTREECPVCPVLQICKGACMFTEGKLWDASCDAAFSNAIPIWATGFEQKTGFVPFRIEGPHRKDRHDIFNISNKASSKKKVIPIIPIK